MADIPLWSWDAFRVWALADYGKAKTSLYYYSSRIRAMVRLGLDLEECMADPKALKRQGDAVVADSKSAGRSGHIVRNYQRALNWLSDYGRHLEQDAIRYSLGRGVDDQDVEERVRRWPRWKLAKEPKSSPKSVDVADLGVLWTYTAAKDPSRWPAGYTTALRRCIAELAYVGNFRRGEMPQVRLRGLLPRTGQVILPSAMKGSISGAVEVPWSLFWPDSCLMQFLKVRVDVPGDDSLFTVPAGNGSKKPRALGAAAIYEHLRAMGKELGVPLCFIRTKRRQLSDQDEANVHTRVIKAKGRHVKIQNTEQYLGQVTGARQRRELADRGFVGYAPEAALRVVDLDGRPVFATAIGPVAVAEVGARHPAPVQPQDADVLRAASPPGLGAPVEGSGPVGRGGRGGLPARPTGGEVAGQELHQRDGRAQRAGPAASAAARRLTCATCGQLLAVLEPTDEEQQDASPRRDQATEPRVREERAQPADEHERSAARHQALAGRDASLRRAPGSDGLRGALDGRGGRSVRSMAEAADLEAETVELVGDAVLRRAHAPEGDDEQDERRRGNGQRQIHGLLGADGHLRRVGARHKGLPEFCRPLPPQAPSRASGPLLKMPRLSQDPTALYGDHGLSSSTQADALTRVVPGQEAVVDATAPAPLSYIDLEHTHMQHTPVLTKKGSLGAAEPITIATVAWRPTGAVDAAPAGLPAHGIQALDSAAHAVAEERAFTRSPGVAPTGASREPNGFTRPSPTRAATLAEMRAFLPRRTASRTSTERCDAVEVRA